MFPTFVINLDSQPDRYEQFKKRFSQTDLVNIVRIPGCDGKQNRNHPLVNSYARPFLTDAMIGCGLSHILLARHIVDLNSPFALVLEDDVVPLRNDLSHVVYTYFEEFCQDVDVIRFFCQGICPTKNSRLSGSTSVYLITHEGAKKLSATTLSYHIDIQMNNINLIIRNSNEQLFTTLDFTKHYDYSLSNQSIMNQKIGFWQNQYAFRIPILEIDVRFGEFFALTSVIFCVYWLLFCKLKFLKIVK